MTDNLIHARLERAAGRAPDARAVTDAAGSWTYADLADAAAAFAGLLAERGVRPGQRVLLRVGNRREYAALLYGTLRHGAIAVLINPEMKPFQLRSVIADAEPVLTVLETADDEAAVLPELAGRIVRLSDVDFERPGPAEPAAANGADLGLLIYTSGSTSAPKAVMSPHRAVTFAAWSIGQVLRYRADDVVLSAIPPSFDYGLYQLFLAVEAGAELVLAESAHAGVLGLIDRHGVTVVPVVPSFAEMLIALSARSGPVGRVRLFTNTGAALAPAVIRALRSSFPGAQIAPMYGTTECKRITVLEPDGDLAKPNSVGPALPGTEVLIVDEYGDELPYGKVGEIVVRGPHVMDGYWRAPEQTAARFRRDSFNDVVTLHTGDWGHQDEDGHVYFQGRRDDLFKRRGVRTSATEIEAAVLDIAGVSAAVVLVPRTPQDRLVLVAATDRSAAEVMAAVRGRLEAAKVPDICHTVDALPLTPNGKIDRARLRELLESGSPLTPQEALA